MLVLKTGQYSGNIIGGLGQNGFFVSITNYDNEDFNNVLHYHDNAHFSFTLAGGVVEKKKVPYEIMPGNLTYYGPGELHQVLKVPMATRRVNLELEAGFFKDACISDERARVAVARNPDAKFLMIKIYHELLKGDSLSAVTIQMLLLHLVGRNLPSAYDKPLPWWVYDVEEFLRACTDENVTLEALSRIAGLHPVTLSKQFPKYFACTLGEYRRKLKIEKALSMLKHTRVSLTSIAYACGFCDQSHFIRSFREFTGLSPLAYRKL